MAYRVAMLLGVHMPVALIDTYRFGGLLSWSWSYEGKVLNDFFGVLGLACTRLSST